LIEVFARGPRWAAFLTLAAFEAGLLETNLPVFFVAIFLRIPAAFSYD
jgi:hypothetical protein